MWLQNAGELTVSYEQLCGGFRAELSSRTYDVAKDGKSASEVGANARCLCILTLSHTPFAYKNKFRRNNNAELDLSFGRDSSNTGNTDYGDRH